MKRIFRSRGLLEREVPEALDRRILMAADLAAVRRRRTRVWKWGGAFSGMAAAVAVAILALSPAAHFRKPRVSERELLELSDWSSLEQEGFNVSSQLNCGWQDEPAARSSRG